jgi:hypothetical protein
MTPAQREFLVNLVHTQGAWNVHDSAMVLRRKGERTTLPPLDVLEAVCADILASKRYPDPRARLAICNIILQRVQASTPLAPALQAGLNQRLFPDAACASVVPGMLPST